MFDAATNPTASHAFLATLEATGAVGPGTGWTPRHYLIESADGALLGAAPAYVKDHSYGEFVFDWSWANAAEQAGLRYYPKLVSAIPFTPVPGLRLAGRSAEAERALAASIQSDCDSGLLSSAHLLFSSAGDCPAGYLRRQDCRYVWNNRDFGDFDDFLAALSSKRRKEIRRERSRVAAQGLRFETLDAESMDTPTWATVEQCYARTYAVRGQQPYLPPGFWQQLAAAMPGVVKVFVGRHAGADDQIIAAAIALRGRDTLFGRHWGTLVDLHSLHFETCYYQGIDYCIREGLAHYDAGVQGEQKRRRGFDPTMSTSLHYLAHPGLRDAIAGFLMQEGQAVQALVDDQAARTAYRSGAGGE